MVKGKMNFFTAFVKKKLSKLRFSYKTRKTAWTIDVHSK